jgi:hypothetical protein
MMAMLRRFMLLLLMPDNGWSAISPENRDPLFRIALKAWNLRARGAQKGSPAKRTGHTLLVAAQYIQKSPKNNGLLRRFGRSAHDLLVRSYRNSTAFAGYCRARANWGWCVSNG